MLWSLHSWVDPEDYILPSKSKTKYKSTTLLISHYSFDQDLPLECDDEYWETENPDDAFKQPPGKPSKLAYYLAFLRLMNIIDNAQRTIVSTVISI